VVLKKIHNTDPKAYENSAIIYRTNAQSKDFEDRLMASAIPYHIVGSLRFYDREEIRDAIAMISLLNNGKDSVAYERMINKPARGVGNVSIDKVLEYVTENTGLNSNIIDGSRECLEKNLLKGASVTGIGNFLKAYDVCKASIGTMDNGQWLQQILTEFGILDYYIKRDKDENNKDNKRTDNLNQLVNMFSSELFKEGQDGINAFLEFVSLDPTSLGATEGDNAQGVTLITMHNTKGLEYDRVFIVGMEDEIFPGSHEENTVEDLEEERRICYVAMTRARKELYMFCASERLKWGSVNSATPSRFLHEIDERHIEELDLRSMRKNNFLSVGKGLNGFERPRYKNPIYTTPVEGPKKPAVILSKKSQSPKESPVGKYNIRNIGNSKPDVSQEKETFEVGDKIISQFFGPGMISGKRKFGGREVLDVKFDSGRTGTFAADKVDFKKA
ncbi:MAG: ATP-binding domain-containing protein, partial [Sphaerochaetaceae bacterium]|nr:ATP-binding domain-containing protein [Sphaerochaetaceae bacterium]